MRLDRIDPRHIEEVNIGTAEILVYRGDAASPALTRAAAIAPKMCD